MKISFVYLLLFSLIIILGIILIILYRAHVNNQQKFSVPYSCPETVYGHSYDVLFENTSGCFSGTLLKPPSSSISFLPVLSCAHGCSTALSGGTYIGLDPVLFTRISNVAISNHIPPDFIYAFIGPSGLGFKIKLFIGTIDTTTNTFIKFPVDTSGTSVDRILTLEAFCNSFTDKHGRGMYIVYPFWYDIYKKQEGATLKRRMYDWSIIMVAGQGNTTEQTPSLHPYTQENDGTHVIAHGRNSDTGCPHTTLDKIFLGVSSVVAGLDSSGYAVKLLPAQITSPTCYIESGDSGGGVYISQSYNIIGINVASCYPSSYICPITNSNINRISFFINNIITI